MLSPSEDSPPSILPRCLFHESSTCDSQLRDIKIRHHFVLRRCGWAHGNVSASRNLVLVGLQHAPAVPGLLRSPQTSSCHPLYKQPDCEVSFHVLPRRTMAFGHPVGTWPGLQPDVRECLWVPSSLCAPCCADWTLPACGVPLEAP